MTLQKTNVEGETTANSATTQRRSNSTADRMRNRNAKRLPHRDKETSSNNTTHTTMLTYVKSSQEPDTVTSEINVGTDMQQNGKCIAVANQTAKKSPGKAIGNCTTETGHQALEAEHHTGTSSSHGRHIADPPTPGRKHKRYRGGSPNTHIVVAMSWY